MVSVRRNVAAISLFSGCGGLDLGAHAAGVDVVAAVEFDRDSVETLRSNPQFKNCHIYEMDIQDVDPRSLAGDTQGGSSDVTIIIGGPPCQPFSKNGYWITNKKRLGMHDPRNMIGQFFRIVREIQPDGFLLENVESILHPTNRNVVAMVESTIQELGYELRMIRANAQDYGAPQKRKRVFFLASRSQFQDVPRKTHRDPRDTDAPKSLPKWQAVGPVIAPYRLKKFFEPQEVIGDGRHAEALKEVPPGKNYLALTARAGCPSPRFEYGTRFWNFLLKLRRDGASWTIPAQPGPWVGPFHWTGRRLRVPEIAAIQAFPSDYKFKGTRRSIQRQIGNAVPCPMGEAMVDYLIKNLG